MNKNVLFAVAPLVTWHGFVDTYYAWDFNRPETKERSYTTQPLKHDAFGINLAMLGAKVEQGRKRGVLTLQHGDSVDINYAAEPKEGEGLKHLQEAYAGIKLSDEIWLDAGIYLGHIGNESWISKDNWTYSRSLQLDYVPYYATGLRLSGKNWQLHLMNGWQNIKENNSGKAIGTQYVWKFGEKTLTYNTQLGHEPFPGRQTSGTRTYQNLHLEVPGEKVDWKGAVDVGTQKYTWGAASSQWRWRFKDKWATAARLEYFHEENGAINPTGVPGGFRVFGTSLNIDHSFEEGALARLEIRRLQSSEEIYPGKDKSHAHDTFVVASMGVSF